MYYWKNTFSLTAEDNQYIQHIGIKRLYVHYFDVDWDHQRKKEYPRVSIKLGNIESLPCEVVPVIYITNRTFMQINDSALAGFAINTIGKIIRLNEQFNVTGIKEIQIDCDWSETTGAKYFKFLEILKKQLGSKTVLSATIRLHQVKYFEITGVPPVDRGMLMFYNMTPLDEFRTANSIYDKGIAAKYLKNFEVYPLQLDCVLPAYHSVIQFGRNNRVRLISADLLEDIMQSTDFKKVEPDILVATDDVRLKGERLQKGDTIKVDRIAAEETKIAARQIGRFLKSDTLHLGFYHFNEYFKLNYDKENIEDIIDSFR